MSLILRNLLRNGFLFTNLARLSSSSSSSTTTTTYKTPLNSKKTFEPNTVAVTKANKHLNVELFDERETSLGKVSLEAAKEMADSKLLKLVCVDEGDDQTVPKFRLMNGKDLHKLRMEMKENSKKDKAEGKVKNVKEKEIDLNLAIDDHDLGIKLRAAEQMYSKGHLVHIKVLSKKLVYNVQIYLLLFLF